MYFALSGGRPGVGTNCSITSSIISSWLVLASSEEFLLPSTFLIRKGRYGSSLSCLPEGLLRLAWLPLKAREAELEVEVDAVLVLPYEIAVDVLVSRLRTLSSLRRGGGLEGGR